MAMGIFLTCHILDLSDLTVDGSLCTGAAVFAVLYTAGIPLWAAMLAAILVMDLNSNYLKLLSAVVVALFLSVPHWKKHCFPVRKGGNVRT